MVWDRERESERNAFDNNCSHLRNATATPLLQAPRMIVAVR
jgi:hypothetical protein